MAGGRRVEDGAGIDDDRAVAGGDAIRAALDQAGRVIGQAAVL
jgi:hypothetical protein